MSTENSELAVRLKNEANDFFKEKRYHKAIHLYTQSLEEKKDPLVFGNRAQAEINLKKWDRALMDCNRALQMDGQYAKGLYRRAVVLDSLSLHSLALADLDRLISLNGDPSAKILREKIGKKQNTPLVDLKAVPKGDELRMDDLLIDVEIEIVGGEEPSSSTPTVSTPSASLVSPSEVHSLPIPKVFSDFEGSFRKLERSPEDYANYFMKIPISRYGFMFDCLLESQHIALLFEGIHKVLSSPSPSFSLSDVSACLRSLASVSGMDMVLMFLEDEERDGIREVINRLEMKERAEVAALYGL